QRVEPFTRRDPGRVEDQRRVRSAVAVAHLAAERLDQFGQRRREPSGAADQYRPVEVVRTTLQGYRIGQAQPRDQRPAGARVGESGVPVGHGHSLLVSREVAMTRRVAILGGNRIPFARSNGPYAEASNQDMLTATLDGLVARFGLQDSASARSQRAPGSSTAATST